LNQINYTYPIILFITALFLLIADIAIGSVWIPLGDVFQILIGGTPQKAAWSTIIWDFRLPRVLSAVLVGGALSISGLLMQTLFRNPIAGPYVLGISSGASLGVAILLLSGGFSLMSIFGQWALVGVSALGAGLVLFLMMMMAWRVKDIVTLLIVGLMLGSVTSAVVTILEYFSGLQQLKMFVLWSFGSLTRITWTEFYVLFTITLIGLSASFLMIKSLNALLLGEEYAKSMGLKIMSVRYAVIGITALLAGSVTAFCGPIAFIGIAVPHLARMVFQTQNHRILIPLTLLLGAVVMLFCDLVAQLPTFEQTLPINAVTSLIGAPVVIWIVIRRRY
jgi:iron complex transport system permease protein